MRKLKLSVSITCLFALSAVAQDCPLESMLITSATLIDGTGAPRKVVDTRIADGLILEIGSLEPCQGENVLDADGLILAPGFIDTHSHHDLDPLATKGIGAISQGITTIVVGMDGGGIGFAGSVSDLAQELEDSPYPVNVASFSGHNRIRRLVMADDFRRPATNQEIDRMSALLEVDLTAGALGLSTGLEYDPGIYSNKEEVIKLATVAAKYGGVYASHIRSEDRKVFEAIEEFVDIAQRTKAHAHLSHAKIAIIDGWGRAPEVIGMLDNAIAKGNKISADVYPYTYWQSSLTVLFPERDFSDLSAAQWALDHLAPPEGMILSLYLPDPTLVGKSIAEISKIRSLSPAETYLQLINESQVYQEQHGVRSESVIGTSMTEKDIETFVTWVHSNIASDGASVGGHPRGYGAFTRAFRMFVRERKLFSLEELIHKMTLKSASNVGIKGRGVAKVGYPADLVLFDDHEITDTATIDQPTALSQGIKGVWVNGQLVWDGTDMTGAVPGVFLSR